MKYILKATVAGAALFVLTIGTVSDVVAGSGGSIACNLKIQLTMKAEMQPGGAHFKGGEGMEMDQMAGMKMDENTGEGMEMDQMAGMKMDENTGEGMNMDQMAGMKMDENTGEGMNMDQMAGMKMDENTGEGMNMDQMAGMKGAHEIHTGQYGGTFFMAPNKTNHVEGIYSKDCGFRLVLFNAMTQPINVSRFGAFVKYIPTDEDAFVDYRILSPAHEGSVLQVSSHPEIEGEFDVELYVRFPGNDDLTMFNIRVEH